LQMDAYVKVRKTDIISPTLGDPHESFLADSASTGGRFRAVA